MENQDQKLDAVERRESISRGRRQLLKKAGWAIPVIAATPLLNTATAVSATNCDDLWLRLREAQANQDEKLAQELMIKLREGNCLDN